MSSSVLVTGSAGRVGRAVAERLQALGATVRTFDLASGDDLRDHSAVLTAIAGCNAIVHAGAIPHDTKGTPADIVATNLLGTWHVLLAAEQAPVERVVYFSSAQVFGCAEGEGTPDHQPVDDDHRLRAARPYGMSKRLAEEMCEAWTSRTQIPTIVLRPVMIVDDDHSPAGAVDGEVPPATVRLGDVVDAVIAALDPSVGGHHRMILSGTDGFDCARAERVLGWRPSAR